jgi:TolA-binding protein
VTEDKIQHLIQSADRTAGPPVQVSVDLSVIQHRVHRRHLVTLVVPAVAAAVILVALGVLGVSIRLGKTASEQGKITPLQMQVKQLQLQTDATLKLIQEVLENERRQCQLDKLYAELASIPDPLEEIQTQVDKTGFILVYQADQMYRELKLIDSASRMYRRVIELFPQSRWAAVARQRLSEIQESQPNKQI